MQIYMCDHEFRFVLTVRTWKPNSCKHNILKGWMWCRDGWQFALVLTHYNVLTFKLICYYPRHLWQIKTIRGLYTPMNLFKYHSLYVLLGLVMNTKHPLFLPFRIEHRHFYIEHSLFITFKSQPKRRTNACVNIYIAGFD